MISNLTSAIEYWSEDVTNAFAAQTNSFHKKTDNIVTDSCRKTPPPKLERSVSIRRPTAFFTGLLRKDDREWLIDSSVLQVVQVTILVSEITGENHFKFWGEKLVMCNQNSSDISIITQQSYFVWEYSLRELANVSIELKPLPPPVKWVWVQLIGWIALEIKNRKMLQINPECLLLDSFKSSR